MIKAIESEIAWCEKNRDTAKSVDFADGFIAGLKQVFYLIERGPTLHDTDTDACSCCGGYKLFTQEGSFGFPVCGCKTEQA